MKDFENKLREDQRKMDFALRQVIELMKMTGLAGIRQCVDGYLIKIDSNDLTKRN